MPYHLDRMRYSVSIENIIYIIIPIISQYIIGVPYYWDVGIELLYSNIPIL